jgi:peptidoglycan/LPS O-acetylase OafA/YrhL
VEEQFYLVWPLLFLWLRRRSRGALLVFLGASIIAVSAWRSWLYLHDHVGTAYIYNAFETRFDCLAVGCLAGLLAGMERVRGWIAICCRSAFAPLGVIALLLGLEHLGDGWHFSAGLTLDSILMAVLLLQMIQLGEHPLWSWLDSRPLAWLGTLTYSGYLYHHWGLAAGHHIPWESPVLQALAGLGATMLLAAASYWLIERPFLALKSPTARQAPECRPATPARAAPVAEDRLPAESSSWESAGATAALLWGRELPRKEPTRSFDQTTTPLP